MARPRKPVRMSPSEVNLAMQIGELTYVEHTSREEIVKLTNTKLAKVQEMTELYRGIITGIDMAKVEMQRLRAELKELKKC